MLRNSLKLWWLNAVLLAFVLMSAATFAEDLKKGDEAEKDPLLEERAELFAEVEDMESQVTAIRTRERELHGTYRGAVKDNKNLFDPANVDEETGKIILRIQELESEAKALREQLKVILADHPQTVKTRESMDAIHAEIQKLRKDRTKIQEAKVKKVGRLRMIDMELKERRKAAAEEAAAESEEEAVAEVIKDE